MISIGAIIGGPESAFFDTVLCEFMRHCESEGHLSGEPVKVNIVYHLPGSILPPDFIGVRPAKFSRKEKKLMIQAAVEKEMAGVRNRDEILDYIIDVADEAIGVAKTKFDGAKIEYDISKKDRDFLIKFRDLVLG
ncbi:MAG TPA: hypothetical protein VG796_19755 [Verrucomicrobiales bacterium]|nr:hypothetical protein [Verrucomicrobiales bacterium]